MADIKSEEVGEKKSLNFIEQIVEKDLKEGKNGGKVQTRFPPNPTDTSTSVTPRLFALILVLQPTTMASAICVSMIPILPRKMWNM